MNNKDIEIQDTKIVYVAWTNTDLTEGRGSSIPLFVTEIPETAYRLGAGKSVMGSPCPVTSEIAIKVKNRWLIPGQIICSSREDESLKAKRELREAAIDKAKAAGLSDEDIKVLVGGK